MAEPAVKTKPTSGPADDKGKTDLRFPGVGRRLQQIILQSKTLRSVESVIGVFNPATVTHARRLQMMDDPTVSFSHAILRAPIVADNFCVESQDSKVAALVDYAVREVYHELALGAARAVPFGYQALEKVWQSGPVSIPVQDKASGATETLNLDQAWTFARMKALDPMQTLLLYDRDKDEWGGVRGMGKDDQPVDIGPERAVLWSFMAPYVCGKLTGLPQLNKQYTPWWDKQATNLFCNRYFEKKADGQYKVHVPAEIDGPNGTKLDGFAFAGDALMAAKNGEAITLPAEMDENGHRLVDVEILQDDKRGDMYHPRIEYLDLQILRGALIADRAGSAGRGSGIGTGEAAVHFDILQMLLEELMKDWFKVLQQQVVDPLVRYNFGDEVWRASRTRIVSKGISNWMRDLYRVLLQQMTQFEVALKDGKVVKFYEYIDAVGIAETLGVPMKPADQLGPLAHERVDEQDRLDAKGPAGNPGDSNVKGKGGVKKSKGGDAGTNKGDEK